MTASRPPARVGDAQLPGGLRGTIAAFVALMTAAQSERLDRDDRRLSERQLTDDGRDADAPVRASRGRRRKQRATNRDPADAWRA